MQRVLAYVRVSTTEQSVDGMSIDAQLARIRAWADAVGAVIVEEIVDAGVSGTKPLKARPGGARIDKLLASTKPTVDSIVVVRLDRLGRDAAESLSLFKRFRTGKLGLVSVSDQVDLSSAHGRAMAGVAAVFAELERALISARTVEALAELRRQGRAWNHPPLGWRVEGGVLVPDSAEQVTVELIKTLRADGHSYRTIAMYLTAAGATTKRGGQWAAATVRSALLAQPTALAS